MTRFFHVLLLLYCQWKELWCIVSNFFFQPQICCWRTNWENLFSKVSDPVFSMGKVRTWIWFSWKIFFSKIDFLLQFLSMNISRKKSVTVVFSGRIRIRCYYLDPSLFFFTWVKFGSGSGIFEAGPATLLFSWCHYSYCAWLFTVIAVVSDPQAK